MVCELLQAEEATAEKEAAAEEGGVKERWVRGSGHTLSCTSSGQYSWISLRKWTMIKLLDVYQFAAESTTKHGSPVVKRDYNLP